MTACLTFLILSAHSWTGTISPFQEASPKLQPGNPAPPFEVGRWIKGGPIPKLERGTIYVIEFWATWCGPCKEAMPHLSELARAYRGRATFIGVSVWEQNEDGFAGFMKEMAPVVDYALVRDKLIDPKKSAGVGRMSENWLRPAGVVGIPSTFIVDREGKIAWIGHPRNLDAPLKGITEGTWDIATSLKSHNESLRRQEVYKGAYDALDKEDWAAALKLSEEAISIGYVDCNVVRYGALVRLGKTDEAKKLGDGLLVRFKDAWNLIEVLARTIVEPPIYQKGADLDLALKAATRAVELFPHWPAQTTLAHVFYLRGDRQRAIEILEAALKSITASEPLRPKFEKRLEEYKKG